MSETTGYKFKVDAIAFRHFHGQWHKGNKELEAFEDLYLALNKHGTFISRNALYAAAMVHDTIIDSFGEGASIVAKETYWKLLGDWYRREKDINE